MNLRRLLFCLFASAISFQPLAADEILYGDFEGFTVEFNDVTESSVIEPLPLYGTPTVSGDSLFFLEPDFVADTASENPQFIDGRLEVTVSTIDGEATISSFQLLESGGFDLTGDGAVASVSGVGFAETLDGTILSSQFKIVEQSPGMTDWFGTLEFEFKEAVSSFTFTLDNQLFVTADKLSTAAVFKESIELSIEQIPEPTSAAILAFAGIMAATRRRR